MKRDLTSWYKPIFFLDTNILQWQPSDSFGTLGILKEDNSTVANYTAQYMQFKAPSEHALNGQKADLELQIFFRNINDEDLDAFFSILIYKVKEPSLIFKTDRQTDLFDDIDYEEDNVTTSLCIVRSIS